MEKLYTFTNWGDKVYVVDGAGNDRHGVITEIEEPSKTHENVKVTYEGGGFDWFNRDDLESSSEARETAILDVEKEKRG